MTLRGSLPPLACSVSPGMWRRLAGRALLLAVALACPGREAGAGGDHPLPPPPDWVVARSLGESDVVRALARLSHDPNMLGVRDAHMQTADYPSAFGRTTAHAADGAPLAGRMAIWDDGRSRPGVVLVPGLAQSKDQRFVVEVAALLARNGWHVLAIDLRANGESRRLSPAMFTNGWKEAGDILGAVRHLVAQSRATSVAVIGFSLGARSLVRAMGQDEASAIAAGIAVTPALAAGPPIRPPDPGTPPTYLGKFFLDFLGAPSFHDYYQRAARLYGVDLETLHANAAADAWVARVRRPLLLLHALDDFQMLLQLKIGRHDGGTYSLAYRDTVRDHPHVRTLLVDRGNHAGMLYLSDPHWFALSALSYLKHWQARDVPHVTVSVPWLDVFAESRLEGDMATHRVELRSHRERAVGPVDVHMELPPGARLERCWAGLPALGRCDHDGNRLSWTLPSLPGGRATTGPFAAVLDVSRVPRGPFETRFWVTTVESANMEESAAVASRRFRLEKR